MRIRAGLVLVMALAVLLLVENTRAEACSPPRCWGEGSPSTSYLPETRALSLMPSSIGSLRLAALGFRAVRVGISGVCVEERVAAVPSIDVSLSAEAEPW